MKYSLLILLALVSTSSYSEDSNTVITPKKIKPRPKRDYPAQRLGVEPPFVERRLPDTGGPKGCPYDTGKKDSNGNPIIKYKHFKVAFSFDDGPAQNLVARISTSRVMKVLNGARYSMSGDLISEVDKKNERVKAVFFITGANFAARNGNELTPVHHDKSYYDEQFKEHTDNGHYLANHTYFHTSANDFHNDSEWEENALLPLAEYGERLIPAIRLPYGAQAERYDMENTRSDGSTIDPDFSVGKIPLILKNKMIPEWWNIDTIDYRYAARTPEEATQAILSNVFDPPKKDQESELCNKGGGIILMHDIHPTSAIALGALIDKLRDEGHEIVDPKVLRPEWFDLKKNKEFQDSVKVVKKRFNTGNLKNGEKIPDVRH